MAKTPPAPREPLLNRGLIVALASAAIGIAVAAGVPIPDALREAILYAVGVAAPLALAWWARRHVTPTPRTPAPPKE